jgi:hypothetical protein
MDDSHWVDGSSGSGKRSTRGKVIASPNGPNQERLSLDMRPAVHCDSIAPHLEHQWLKMLASSHLAGTSL